MSGVEIAGLLLGALPLVVSALEHYNDGLDPLKAFMRWEKELPKYIRKLRNQHVHFEQTLRQLLAPIATEEELFELLDKPNGDMWKDATLEERLSQRLAGAYVAFGDTMQEIENIMNQIAGKLDVDRTTRITRNDLEAMLIANAPSAKGKYEFPKRVKFGLSKKRIKVLLVELDDRNKELERFLEKSERLESFRIGWKTSFAAPLQQIRLCANMLHNVLTWGCTCHAKHTIRLRLEQRLDVSKTRRTKQKKPQEGGIRFNISFSSSSVPSWFYQEAEVQVVDGSSCTTTSSIPRPTRKVAFSIPAQPEPIQSQIQDVNDLCFALHEAHSRQASIKLSLEGDKLRSSYSAPGSGQTADPLQHGKTITLAEMLHRSPNATSGTPKLSRKECYALAVTLASSVLQLHATPWVKDQWGKADIFFFRHGTALGSFDLDRPYVAQQHAEVQSDPNKVIRTWTNKNTILLALALMLLELYFGSPIEGRQLPEDLGPSSGANAFIALATAQRWVFDEKENLSAAFLQAITHSLRCYADPSSSLQDPTFLQAAVEEILLPLHVEMCQFTGTTM